MPREPRSYYNWNVPGSGGKTPLEVLWEKVRELGGPDMVDQAALLDLANEFGVSVSAVRNKLRDSLRSDTVPTSSSSPTDGSSVFVDGDQPDWDVAWDAFNRLIGDVRDDYAGPADKPRGDRDYKKIVDINDLHSPFQDDRVLAHAIAHHSDADEVYFGGDSMDCYSVSRFTKPRIVPLKRELAVMKRIARISSETWPMVYFLMANHEERVRTHFERQGIPSDLMFLVRTDLIGEFIASKYPNVVSIPNWFVKVGDAVLGHPEINRKNDLASGLEACRRLLKWESPLGIDGFRVLACAHTHRTAQNTSIIGDRWMWVVETGCAARVQDYMLEASLKYDPPMPGYVVLIQRDGVTDLNESVAYRFPEFLLEPCKQVRSRQVLEQSLVGGAA